MFLSVRDSRWKTSCERIVGNIQTPVRPHTPEHRTFELKSLQQTEKPQKLFTEQHRHAASGCDSTAQKQNRKPAVTLISEKKHTLYNVWLAEEESPEGIRAAACRNLLS